MEIKNKSVHIFAIMTVEVLISIDCLHLIPTSYPCCDSLPPLPAGGIVIPSPQPFDAFELNPETVPFLSGQKAFGQSMPQPFAAADDTSAGYHSKAYGCSLLPCLPADTADTADTAPVCACNFNTGHVVTFKNSCDVNKHNCRFDTVFKVILNEVCPWEFESRRANKQFELDYNDPKYYNK